MRVSTLKRKAGQMKNQRDNYRFKYRREHSLRRLEQRYNLTISYAEYDKLRHKLAAGLGKVIGIDGSHEKRNIRYKNKSINVRFDPKHREIMTFPPNHAQTNSKPRTLGEVLDFSKIKKEVYA